MQGKLTPQHADSAIPLLTGSGATVGANRGASGIDGVLSSAAGFAEGLARGTTLVVRLPHLLILKLLVSFCMQDLQVSGALLDL